ncbi:MAG: 16S rRNA (uracil(1498)-N(3))-methyltransferase [Chthoniobacterales bacterium]
MNRFFLEPESWEQTPVCLNPRESHHCAKVLRHKVGEQIEIFDGRGKAAAARLLQITKNAVELELDPPRVSPKLPAKITLAQAIPKGKNMDLIIQKSVELGVACIQPLLSERTVIHLDAAEGEKKLEKWRDVLLDACKQSGQNWLPELLPICSLADYLCRAESETGYHFMGSLGSDALPFKSQLHSKIEAHLPGESVFQATMLVGPEGDFSPNERQTATQAGFIPVSFGPIVLRSETAAIFCLSALAYELH